LLPSDDFLVTISRHLNSNYIGNPSLALKDALKPVMDIYDYIIIDTPPALSEQTINALGASTHVVIMFETSKFEEKLERTWSPEQIAGRIKDTMPSFKTIYRWLYAGKMSQGNLTVLRQKGKRRHPRETRGRFNMGKSIKQRSKEVRKREQFGHWELDTVVSSRGQSKGCMATFAERKTRFYLAIKIPNRTALSMTQAVTQVVTNLPKGIFKTATVDRGKEFA
jgi:hypothetical protein